MTLIQSCLPPQNIFQLLIYTSTEESLSQLREVPLYSIWIEAITPLLEKPRKTYKYKTVYSPLIKAVRPPEIQTIENDETE